MIIRQSIEPRIYSYIAPFPFQRSQEEHLFTQVVKSIILDLAAFMSNKIDKKQMQMHTSQWQMTLRNTYHSESLFKAKIVNDDSFIVAFPRGRKVETLDLNLNSLNTTYKFSEELQAIEKVELEGRGYVLAGLRNGRIQGIPQEAGAKITLQLEGQLIASNYINDMVDLGNNRLGNCYNTGDIAFWNLSDLTNPDKLITKMEKVHSTYTYKMRLVDSNRLVSCGHDGKAVLIDINKGFKISELWHPDSVWCCYPFNESTLCSGGLMGELLFWDVRTEAVTQMCSLQHQETSFITRLDDFSVIFGDQRDVSKCDMRMFRKELLCMKKMKTSVECVCVTKEGGIGMGRGGDLCRFVEGEEEVECAQRQIGSQMMMNFDRIIEMLQRGWVGEDEEEILQEEGLFLDADDIQDDWDNDDEEILNDNVAPADVIDAEEIQLDSESPDASGEEEEQFIQLAQESSEPMQDEQSVDPSDS